MNLTIYVFIEMGGHLWVIQSFAGSFLALPFLKGNSMVMACFFT